MEVRMTRMPKVGKAKVVELANKLGYTVETNYGRIYLIKDEVKISYRSYYKSYCYLYSKLRRKAI